jgi:phosphonatase-like hydrolase
MIRPAIRLAVLDLAGTTVSDAGAVEKAFRQALASVSTGPDDEGRPIAAAGEDPATFVRRTIGQSKITVFTELLGGDTAAADRANRTFESAFDTAVDQCDVVPVPAPEATIRALQRAGVRVCFTTGFSPATRDRIIDTLGWGELADLVLSPSDAGRGRPWPDMILTAVLRLEVDSVAKAAVAGATVSDLVAGTRSGASVVAGC